MCRLRTSASCGSGLPGPHEHETEPPHPQVTTDELLGCSSVKPRLWLWWMVGGLLEVLVDGAGDAAFEGSDGLAGGVALGAAPLVGRRW
jgi:hypothetical protein